MQICSLALMPSLVEPRLTQLWSHHFPCLSQGTQAPSYKAAQSWSLKKCLDLTENHLASKVEKDLGNYFVEGKYEKTETKFSELFQ